MTHNPVEFPRTLTYFWFLNSDCSPLTMRRQLKAFVEAGTATVVLHPREGLLVPYAGEEWFDLVRTLADDLEAAGVQAWLYDEDYCPSGQGGGWILAEHPEFLARSISRFEAAAHLEPGSLFFFPAGVLLWAGIVSDDDCANATINLTQRVGLIRRHWEASEWDSRHYYPAMPIYPCPRSGAYVPEFALRVPTLTAGQRLVAFVALDAGPDSPYGGLLDSLNPTATQHFIDRIYEGYAKALGNRLGRSVPAIFIDEPKAHGEFPWTPDLFQSFERQFGYDLRPRLQSLFAAPDSRDAARARIDYRAWVGRRFEEAWLTPVSQWCHRHQIHAVGHISPEDDPLQQAACVGNLMPLQKHFALPGLDLIIPAVGDERHPLLNVGLTLAVSAAQQRGRAGVLSEILGASGLDLTGAEAAKILAWQVMSGVSAPVIHAAFSSTLGLRLFDAPPDCGPDSPRWEAMQDIDRGLRPFLDIVGGSDATQVAPVALLWPIRTFAAMPPPEPGAPCPARDQFAAMLLACLQAQVGVHLLDEADLQSAQCADGAVRIGRASYTVILIHQAKVLHSATLDALAAAERAGVKVWICGEPPEWRDTEKAIESIGNLPGERATADDWTTWCRQHLPNLMPTQDAGPHRSLRISTWVLSNQTFSLMMNLSDSVIELATGPQTLTLEGGELVAVSEPRGTCDVIARFSPRQVRANRPSPTHLAYGPWQVRFAGEDWRNIDAPRAVYQMRDTLPKSGRRIRMVLTGWAAMDGESVAEFVEYRTTVSPSDRSSDLRATMILEPTAVRGKVRITAGNHQVAETLIADSDNCVREIDLSNILRDTDATIVFHFERPMSLDGLKRPPIIVSGAL